MSRTLTGQTYDSLVVLAMGNDSVCPEMGASCADQQEMLEDFFEFLLFYPVFLGFSTSYLQDILVLDRCL